MIVKTNRILKVTANKQKRTFTIRIKYENGANVTYRTIPLSKEEFEAEQGNTQHDWIQFLKSDDYYRILK